MIYFWSDTHFNHANILKHAGRPWSGVREMNEALIATWNATVTSERDTVYHLGDFGYHAPNNSEGEDLSVIWWKLRGRKHLVIGNHDVKNPQTLRLPWETQEQIGEVKKDGLKLVLCHYPMESWPGMHKGRAHLHGHCHGSLRRKMPKRLDMSVEVHGRPLSWDEVWEIVNAQPFVPVDHHGEELA